MCHFRENTSLEKSGLCLPLDSGRFEVKDYNKIRTAVHYLKPRKHIIFTSVSNNSSHLIHLAILSPAKTSKFFHRRTCVRALFYNFKENIITGKIKTGLCFFVNSS